MTERVERALAFSRIAHAEQVRKYSGIPYWTHPLAVADIVATVTDDEDMYIAALLHDTIEDTVTTDEDIDLFFGSKIANLVVELTDISVPSDGNRETRKAIDRNKLAMVSAAAQTIKLADLLHNTPSIVWEGDIGFARIYLNEKAQLLDVLSNGDESLMVKSRILMVESLMHIKHIEETLSALSTETS